MRELQKSYEFFFFFLAKAEKNLKSVNVSGDILRRLQ